DLVAAVDQVGQLAHHHRGLLDRLALAVQRDHVAAQEQVAVDVALQPPQHLVLGAAERGGDVVADLDLAAHQPSTSRASAETRLPSARPATRSIASFITAPMSFGDEAPVSATACSTIARSSSSLSSAGR